MSNWDSDDDSTYVAAPGDYNRFGEDEIAGTSIIPYFYAEFSD